MTTTLITRKSKLRMTRDELLLQAKPIPMATKKKQKKKKIVTKKPRRMISILLHLKFVCSSPRLCYRPRPRWDAREQIHLQWMHNFASTRVRREMARRWRGRRSASTDLRVRKTRRSTARRSCLLSQKIATKRPSPKPMTASTLMMTVKLKRPHILLLALVMMKISSRRNRRHCSDLPRTPRERRGQNDLAALKHPLARICVVLPKRLGLLTKRSEIPQLRL